MASSDASAHFAGSDLLDRSSSCSIDSIFDRYGLEPTVPQGNAVSEPPRANDRPAEVPPRIELPQLESLPFSESFSGMLLDTMPANLTSVVNMTFDIDCFMNINEDLDSEWDDDDVDEIIVLSPKIPTTAPLNVKRRPEKRQNLAHYRILPTAIKYESSSESKISLCRNENTGCNSVVWSEEPYPRTNSVTSCRLSRDPNEAGSYIFTSFPIVLPPSCSPSPVSLSTHTTLEEPVSALSSPEPSLPEPALFTASDLVPSYEAEVLDQPPALTGTHSVALLPPVTLSSVTLLASSQQQPAFHSSPLPSRPPSLATVVSMTARSSPLSLADDASVDSAPVYRLSHVPSMSAIEEEPESVQYPDDAEASVAGQRCFNSAEREQVTAREHMLPTIAAEEHMSRFWESLDAEIGSISSTKSNNLRIKHIGAGIGYTNQMTSATRSKASICTAPRLDSRGRRLLRRISSHFGALTKSASASHAQLHHILRPSMESAPRGSSSTVYGNSTFNLTSPTVNIVPPLPLPCSPAVASPCSAVAGAALSHIGGVAPSRNAPSSLPPSVVSSFPAVANPSPLSTSDVTPVSSSGGLRTPSDVPAYLPSTCIADLKTMPKPFEICLIHCRSTVCLDLDRFYH
ncbi:hypothetical protein FISHEDRAFT_60429 [Fistulina hepatica ATCC 64428]|uniref:Uncharacterized protein n=1 Tax=Fistulina hepatica ATCC 64428 TaxID=1128425 RepID=A0A0D7A7G5_9AGAR|nr:hypothetical protein FISHEDRAFT_60429 [Fistulina hepatica ATCC 64428]